MLRALVPLLLLGSLSGCALLFEEAVLSEATAGMSSTEVIAGGVSRGIASSEAITVSEEVGSSFRGVRFSPAIRGRLSASLSQLTDGGARQAILRISPSGDIVGNDYVVARLGRNGVIYTPRGARLGLIGDQGLLREYLRDGSLRPVGYVRGLTTRPASLFQDATATRRIAQIPPNSLLRVWRTDAGGYRVSLENRTEGWIPAGLVATLAILGANQLVATCGHEQGAVVTKSSRYYQYERCDEEPDGLQIVSDGRILKVPRESIGQIWRGELGGNAQVRGAMLVSLRDDGYIYPPTNAYKLYPEGDPRGTTRRPRDLMEAPE